MEKSLVWNGTWNGNFSVWNVYGMEEIRQCRIWKNHLPFHGIPCTKLGKFLGRKE